MPEDFDCIVLGAGMSGITAARDLKLAGKRVLLLEAAAAAGGRMRSKSDFARTSDGSALLPGFPVEEGADWIHVADEGHYAAFHTELRKHGFRAEEFEKGRHNRVFFPDWGMPFTAADAWIVSSIKKMASKTTGLFAQVKAFKLNGLDKPAGQFVKSLGYQDKTLSISLYAISAHTPGVLDPLNLGQADDISVAGLKADQIPRQLREEESEFELRTGAGRVCGYDRLPEAILGEFRKPGGAGAGTDLLNQEVTSVAPEGAGLRVKTRQNPAGWSARSAVSTFSVGLLNPVTGIGDDIFGPYLTATKQTALEIVKMGAITKFMLQFRDWAWAPNPPTTQGFEMAVLSHPTGAAQPWEARTFFASFPTHRNGPHVLYALLMGKDHEIVSRLTDAEATEYLFRIIERIYTRNPGVPWRMEDRLVWRTNPDGSRTPNVYRKDWSVDPWARGGNSYIRYRPGQTAQEAATAREKLKSPLETLPLFWAGEATAPAYNPRWQPLSVHGAYKSGVEVAKDVGHFLDQGEQSFRTYYEKKYSR